jgi:NADPH2:quinone reductase
VKAVGLLKYLPIKDESALMDFDLPKPIPKPKDLLVKVKAIGLNPVDTKIRAPKSLVEKEPKILGWDAAGIVESVGSDVKNFKVGDEVYYAGDISRQGCNAEFHCVDERIVGLKPRSLSFAESAALPLTSITAWEALFDRMAIDPKGAKIEKRLLIIGAAGGVGSIAIQLAKTVPALKITATASRKESVEWCKSLGAHEVIDHGALSASDLGALANSFDYIFCCQNTDDYFEVMTKLVAPEGAICTIVESHQKQEIALLMQKSVRFCYELMFTRSLFQTADMGKQGELLNRVASLVDEGRIRTTSNQTVKGLNAKVMRDAHRQIEERKTIGKLVIEL